MRVRVGVRHRVELGSLEVVGWGKGINEVKRPRQMGNTYYDTWVCVGLVVCC